MTAKNRQKCILVTLPEAPATPKTALASPKTAPATIEISACRSLFFTDLDIIKFSEFLGLVNAALSLAVSKPWNTLRRAGNSKK